MQQRQTVSQAASPSNQTMNMGTVVNLRICESVVEIGTNNVLTLSIFAWRPRNISKPCWGTGDPGPCGLIDGHEYQMLNRPHALGATARNYLPELTGLVSTCCVPQDWEMDEYLL